jgi:hypothetical protein
MKSNPYIYDILTYALTNHLPLSEVQLTEQGDEREAVDREVQDLAIDVFSRIMEVAGGRGIEELIPGIRARLAELFELDQHFFELLPEEKEHLLVTRGRVFVPLTGGNLLAKIRLAVEKAFIARSHSLTQQKRVIRLVSQLTGPHLCGQGKEHGDLVFEISTPMLNALQMAVHPPLQTAVVQSERFQSRQEDGLSLPKAQSQAKLEKLNLDWDDIEWEAEG